MNQTSVAPTLRGSSKQRPVKKRRWPRRLLWGVAAVGALGLGYWAARPRPLAVEVAAASVGDFVVTVREDGATRVKDRYLISAPLAGTLLRPRLHVGDAVKPGDPLAQLVASAAPLLDLRAREQAQARVAMSEAALQQVEAQANRAQLALDFAKSESARLQTLVRENIAPSSQVDQARFDERARHAELASAQFGVKVARYERSLAKAALGRFDQAGAPAEDQVELVSPVSGMVLRVLRESGGLVAAGTALLELGEPRALEVVVDVLTREAVAIQPRAPVVLTAWGGGTLQAQVRMVEPAAFTKLSALGVEEQRVNVIVDFVDSYEQWQTLGDGYRVEASIEVKRLQNVLSVPATALFRRRGEWAVFRVDSGIAQLVPVQVGERNDREVQILSGLSALAPVIVHPSDRVETGAQVQPLE